MAWIDLFGIDKNYDVKPIFKGMNFHLEAGERVAIIGQNGSGKSTLMKIALGIEACDEGKRIVDRSVQIGMLSQQPTFPPGLNTREAIEYALTELRTVREAYETLSIRLGEEPENKALLDEHARASAYLDHHNAWDLGAKIERVLQEFRLKEYENRLVDSLSGGEQRRVALATLILRKPDILMLDEPTNHLDVYMVAFLEEILLKEHFTLLLISHDRYFIDTIATRIVEIENQALVTYKGGYKSFLTQKERRLSAMQKQHENLIRFLKKEEAWLSRGIQARQTRNQGRKRRVFALREAAKKNPTLIRKMKVELDRERKAFMGEKIVAKRRVLFDIRHLDYTIAGKKLIEDFTLRILQKDTIAVVGHNGSGKSTFLRLLLGALTPDHGSIKRGQEMTIGYFDQHRAMLHDDETLIGTFCPDGGDRVMVAGKNMHVYGYLKNFLFPKAYLDKRIGQLSGGEKNRVALALLLTQAYDCLMLDEPTNDLDIQTINILDEELLAYQGALIFVSHDRYFVDKIAHKLLIFKGEGIVEESYQPYSEYLALEKDLDTLYQIEKELKNAPKDASDSLAGDAGRTPAASKKPAKLSYKDQRDLELLPAQIEELEEKIDAIDQCLYDPDCYEAEGIVAVSEKLARLQNTYTTLSERYLDLLQKEEDLQSSAKN